MDEATAPGAIISGQPTRQAGHTRARRLAESVTGLLDEVFAHLAELSDTVVRAVGDAQAVRDPENLHAALAESCHAALAEPRESVVSGLGFVADLGCVLPSQLWMVWWVSEGGAVLEKRHNLNPSSDAFYDYRQAEWFAVPSRTSEPCVAGPYIDSWGTDDFTITTSDAVVIDGEFVGVVAADLAVRRIEPLIAGQLRAIREPAVLVNAEDRVVASGVSDLTTGLRLSPRTGTGSAGPALARFPVGYGWSVVLLSR